MQVVICFIGITQEITVIKKACLIFRFLILVLVEITIAIPKKHVIKEDMTNAIQSELPKNRSIKMGKIIPIPSIMSMKPNTRNIGR